MGNVGGAEVLVILLVALIVLGPTKLPTAIRQVGRVVGEIRRIGAGFQQELREATQPIKETAATLKAADPRTLVKPPAPAAGKGSATGRGFESGKVSAAAPSSVIGKDSASGEGSASAKDSASGEGSDERQDSGAAEAPAPVEGSDERQDSGAANEAAGESATTEDAGAPAEAPDSGSDTASGEPGSGSPA